MQAAILRVKLPLLDSWNKVRRSIAARYNAAIDNHEILKPTELSYGEHNYHLYVIRCDRRDELRGHLAERGVSTIVHYPIPIHMQEAFQELRKLEGDYPISERHACTVLSLPIFPELSEPEIEHVVTCINDF
jgi:dTDP-4-amino-4,6-dideoxygalactose transaminase